MRSIFTSSPTQLNWRLVVRRLVDWKPANNGLAVRALVSATTMGAPLTLGFLTGHFTLGLGIALGCLSIPSPFHHDSFREALLDIPQLMLPALVAAVIALLAATIPPAADEIFLGCALAASLSIRYSRPVAIAATRFMIYLFIFGNALLFAPIPLVLFALICLGICWMTLVSVIASGVKAQWDKERDKSTPAGAAARIRRMRRELKNLSTWDYPARLTLGIALSLWLKSLYPAHHFYWASLTVLLCTPRQFELWPIRAAQRAVGTLFGVVAAELLMVAVPGSTAVLIALIGLCFARRWFDEHSYLLYSAVMAPLILFLMGPEKLVASSAASDRLLATAVGALIVLLANVCAAGTTARTLAHKNLKQQLETAE